MRIDRSLTILAALMLFGCAPSVDEQLISYFGAPEENMSQARKAADLCVRKSPVSREVHFRQAGFLDAMFDDPNRDIADIRAIILIHPSTGVAVQLGEDGGRSGCTVGLKGMSPQQSHDLALPWVRRFSAVSNAELGQGLSPNAIQAWRTVDDQPNNQPTVFIAAYKTWDILEAPGAAIRISR